MFWIDNIINIFFTYDKNKLNLEFCYKQHLLKSNNFFGIIELEPYQNFDIIFLKYGICYV